MDKKKEKRETVRRLFRAISAESKFLCIKEKEKKEKAGTPSGNLRGVRQSGHSSDLVSDKPRAVSLKARFFALSLERGTSNYGFRMW